MIFKDIVGLNHDDDITWPCPLVEEKQTFLACVSLFDIDGSNHNVDVSKYPNLSIEVLGLMTNILQVFFQLESQIRT